MSRRVCGDNVTGLVGGCEEVEDKQAVVPDEDDKEVDDTTNDFVDDAHLCLYRSVCCLTDA